MATREELIEAAAGAWRPERPTGEIGSHPRPPRDRRAANVNDVFVAIRYSQVRSELRPSNASSPRHAANRASWRASSASWSDASSQQQSARSSARRGSSPRANAP